MNVAPLEDMMAVTFVLTLDCTRLAFAVICTAARYCGLGDPASGRVDRRYLSALAWKHVEVELARGLPADPLPPDSAILTASLPIRACRSARVQYVTTEPVAAAPEELVARLDALLACAVGPQP